MTYEKTLSALADPTRRAVLERLRGGPLPVGRIAEGLPVSRPAVSQHLSALKAANLVRDEQQGTARLYRIHARGLEELRDWLEDFWGEVLDNFKNHAEGEDS